MAFCNWRVRSAGPGQSRGSSMALIDCPDCGAQISDAAHACPRCARPFLQGKSTGKQPDVRGIWPSTIRAKVIWVIGALALIVAVVFIEGGMKFRSSLKRQHAQCVTHYPNWVVGGDGIRITKPHSPRALARKAQCDCALSHVNANWVDVGESVVSMSTVFATFFPRQAEIAMKYNAYQRPFVQGLRQCREAS